MTLPYTPPSNPSPRSLARGFGRRIESTILPWLEGADVFVYVLVGLVFLVAAFGMPGYSVLSFPANLEHDGFALVIVTLINDLLLVMIIMEVLRTVLAYPGTRRLTPTVPVHRRHQRHPAHPRHWRPDERGRRDPHAWSLSATDD